LFEVDAEGDPYEMFESMRIYIERFGRPYNYLKSVLQLNDEREKVLVDEENKNNQGNNNSEASKAKETEQQKALLEAKFEERLLSIKKHMKDLESCDDLNMR
jgi:hypothetical protein